MITLNYFLLNFYVILHINVTYYYFLLTLFRPTYIKIMINSSTVLFNKLCTWILRKYSDRFMSSCNQCRSLTTKMYVAEKIPLDLSTLYLLSFELFLPSSWIWQIPLFLTWGPIRTLWGVGPVNQTIYRGKFSESSIRVPIAAVAGSDGQSASSSVGQVGRSRDLSEATRCRAVRALWDTVTHTAAGPFTVFPVASTVYRWLSSSDRAASLARARHCFSNQSRCILN